MTWTIKEEEIVVLFYLRHPSDYSSHMDEVMAELSAAGFTTRDETSAKMRVGNVESVHTGGMRGLSHPAQQTINVYNKITEKNINKTHP